MLLHPCFVPTSLVLATGLLLGGCATLPGTPVEASALCPDVAQLVCETDARCFDGPAAMSACVTAQRRACDQTVGVLLDDARLGYDAARAGAFLASLEESAESCWERPVDHDAFVAIFGGTGAAGADCTPRDLSAPSLRTSALSCADGNACRLHLRIDGSTEGVCEARRDAACSHALDCEADAYCSLPARWQPGVWGECRPRRADGWACASDLECESHHCDGSCSPRPADRRALQVDYPTLVGAAEPALYLRLDETSGARADEVGAVPAAAVGAVGRDAEGAIADDMDGAARLSAGAFLRAPAPDALEASEELTLECWFRPDDLGAARPILELADAMHFGAHIWSFDSGDKVYANFVDAAREPHSVMSEADAVAAGQWHHVVASYDGVRGVLYLDGRRIGETAVSGALRVAGDLYVGHRSALGEESAVDFVGSIDEVAVYDHALSAATVGRHHTAGVEGPLTNDFPLFTWLR